MLQQETLRCDILLVLNESGRGYIDMISEIRDQRIERAYEFHGIEFLNMALEMQPLTQPAKLFGDILSIARLRSVQDQDASLVARHCGGDGSQLHGRRCLLSVRMAWNSHDNR